MSSIQTTTLKNGLRVVTDHVPGIGSIALGVWVGVGTRHENMAHNGVAHMVEHMLFKGTEERSARDIVESIENVGGAMNAYTSREVTSYHMHMLADDTELALDVLADMIQNSTMLESEIESERHVILQEIGMCHDTPDDVIFDNYYETAYAGQALGAPILGTNDIISGMQREALQAHVQGYYTPENIVISAAGNLNHDKFTALVEKYFQTLPSGKKAEKKAADYTGGEIRIEKDLEQTHVIIGFQGVSRLSSDFYSAQALSALFGGGMSSRLFQEIREKRGLVYSIFSFHSSYSDDGQFGIYAGTGPNDLKELVPVVCDEILKLADTLTEEEVTRAKTQIRSSLIMGRESMMTRADQQAKYLIFRDKKLDIEDIIAQIDALNKEKITDVTHQIFSSKPTMSFLGPLKNLDSYEAIQNCLDSTKAA